MFLAGALAVVVSLVAPHPETVEARPYLVLALIDLFAGCALLAAAERVSAGLAAGSPCSWASP